MTVNFASEPFSNMFDFTKQLCRRCKHKTLNSCAVASPGFVARKGIAGDYVMGHSRQISGPGAAAAR